MTKKRKKKKTYNPFKMWGSWIGILMGIFLKDSISWRPFYFSLCDSNINPAAYQETIAWLNCIGRVDLIFGIISGFLIGWGIHSLIRKYQ